ncbi:MAG TPA: hypothetical protein DCF65_01595, partial [Chloroflexi bacterium]|nr:hypothetical protein [Chloroflexota bacterium]
TLASSSAASDVYKRQAGGYPLVATVVSASMPIAAQLVPGDELDFKEVTLERARQMRLSLAAALETLR